MTDVALLACASSSARCSSGTGGQKLFGWFGGHGLRGTGVWLESLGLRPGCRSSAAVR
jgi:putative oxidoreductase